MEREGDHGDHKCMNLVRAKLLGTGKRLAGRAGPCAVPELRFM
jgi:hypothetical protein